MTLRQEHPAGPEAPRFERARSWRAWDEWPGIMGLATGLALWVFFAMGVVAPLADAVARFESQVEIVPAQVCTTTDDGTLAAAGQSCVCACPEAPPPESLPRSG
jgi:hypothetical protein